MKLRASDLLDSYRARFGGRVSALWPEGLNRHAARIADFPDSLLASAAQGLPPALMAASSGLADYILSQPFEKRGNVAIIPVTGVITQDVSFWELFGLQSSTARIGAQLAAALADPDTEGIVFNINSPGGEVYGTPELAARILAARDSKKTVAMVSGLAASAAYWLASQCAEIVIQPSGDAGSIGVYTVHFDQSGFLAQAGIAATEITAGKYKAEYSPLHALTEDARAELQKSVDATYADFLAAVAKGRGATVSEVRQNYGEGRVLMARDAVKAGMADRTGTLDDALKRAGLRRAEPAAQKSSGGRSATAARDAARNRLRISEVR